MKLNQPITDNEHLLKSGSVLVSKTDLSGVITYCNQDFIETSGFKAQELIGSSHHLVRHPDMPQVVFADLWRTIQAGQPWSGVIKNRCKNGDFYWVKANITPLTRSGRVIEYMSVRTPPSREEVEQADSLYRSLGRDRVSLRPGEVMGLHQRGSFKLKTLLSGAVFILITLLAALGGMVVIAAPPAMLLGVLVLAAVLVMVGGLMLMRYITAPLAYAQGKLQQISEGSYFDWIECFRSDEIGMLLKAIKSTQIKLGFDVIDARRQAGEALRIKTALDNVSSPVMMVDGENSIIYMNRSLQQLFKRAERDIQQDLPGFSTDRMLGSAFDRILQQTQYQYAVSEILATPHQIEIKTGTHLLRLVTNPVVNAEGKRLGTAIEWSDLTAEVAVEREIDGIIASARAGDLSSRILMQGKRGFFAELGGGINLLLDVVEKAFSDIAVAMSEIANGDLTKPITREYQGAFDQVKRDVNGTLANLEEIMTALRESSMVINRAAVEIAAGNISLSQRTERQAGVLEESSASLVQLTATLRNNAEHAQRANQFATSARQLAERGGVVVNQAIQAMVAINSSSSKITEIIGVIDEIAFQTNLLALNASVEAARAGEHGRGFAVVATEVRNLAGRSATAAKKIKELIRDSTDKVRAGEGLVNESGKALGEILMSVTQVGELISGIATASQQQSIDIERVNRAASSLDQVTQQNAALAEKTSAAAASMSEKTREMERLMDFFTLSRSRARRVMDPLRSAIPVNFTGSESCAVKASVQSPQAGE